MSKNKSILMSATAVLLVCSPLFAETNDWFDTGISHYTDWPTGNAEKLVKGQGVWRETENTKLVGNQLKVDSQEEDAPLLFDPAVQKSLSTATLIYSFTTRFCANEGEYPARDAASKCALSVFRDEDQGEKYCGLVKDSEGATNVWVTLTGATPDLLREVDVEMILRQEGSRSFVQYRVEGTALQFGGEEWLEVVDASEMTGTVAVRGEGAVAALSAQVESSVPVVYKTLTIPKIKHVSVKHVKIVGVEVKADEAGAYAVEEGSVVTVTFTPDAGWGIDVSSMTFVVKADMELPEEGRPKAFDIASAILITEVMAKNDVTLKTKTGFEGLDWVEFYNSGENDADLTGWYFGNDPEKKASKWKQIEGSCIVPAHGYKILWCDGDELCANWAKDEAHVEVNVSTEAGKHTLFLAPSADKKAITQKIALPAGLKDISYGRKYVSAEQPYDPKADFVYFETPTPEAVNGTSGRTGFTPKVAFSEPHGYKDASFDLALSCSERPDAAIYYTLDGSSPVVGNAKTFLYEAPITISKTTVVRAAVPDADTILQQDTTATYLFIEDILASNATPPEGFPASGAVNGQAMRYGMNTAITQSADADTQARLRRGFTNGVRTVSLVIDSRHLFDPTTGIYVNATGNGVDWERPVQVEQINPLDVADEFSVPAGLRIRGASSRANNCPKHSFRLFFRSEYGMGTLKHALFGDEGTDAFEKIDLRTEQNFAWANGYGWETFVHEVFARDSQRDLGQPYNRSRYYHLFINGHYWGLYQTEERVDQNYAESYGGGAADNYDIIRTSQPGYVTGVVEGDWTAWTEFWRITTQEGYGEGHEANYNRVRGLNPDGTRNKNYPIYLNVTNLICYMLTSQFAADSDSPVHWTTGMANNLAAFRNRVDGSGKIDGFIWNRHDAEGSLTRGGTYTSGKTEFLSGTRGAGYNVVLGNFNPAALHYELSCNDAYRKTFADLVYRHILKKGGALTAPVAEARFRARMAELDDAIVCESARWGNKDLTRASWLHDCEDCIDFINQRIPYLIKIYQDLGWYPKVELSAFLDWPEDPETEILETTTPTDLSITKGALTNAVPHELKKLSTWAKARGVSFGSTLISKMAFDEMGNPLTMGAEAYLLNCAPTKEAVQAQKATFKFDEIIPGVQPTIDGTGYNGQVKILGCESLGNGWSDVSDSAHFFKAILIR